MIKVESTPTIDRPIICNTRSVLWKVMPREIVSSRISQYYQSTYSKRAFVVCEVLIRSGSETMVSDSLDTATMTIQLMIPLK